MRCLGKYFFFDATVWWSCIFSERSYTLVEQKQQKKISRSKRAFLNNLCFAVYLYALWYPLFQVCLHNKILVQIWGVSISIVLKTFWFVINLYSPFHYHMNWLLIRRLMWLVYLQGCFWYFVDLLFIMSSTKLQQKFVLAASLFGDRREPGLGAQHRWVQLHPGTDPRTHWRHSSYLDRRMWCCSGMTAAMYSS